MERTETRRDGARTAAKMPAAERYLTIFSAIAGAVGAFVWLCLSLFN
jgi:hypothetical protein